MDADTVEDDGTTAVMWAFRSDHLNEISLGIQLGNPLELPEASHVTDAHGLVVLAWQEMAGVTAGFEVVLAPWFDTGQAVELLARVLGQISAPVLIGRRGLDVDDLLVGQAFQVAAILEQLGFVGASPPAPRPGVTPGAVVALEARLERFGLRDTGERGELPWQVLPEAYGRVGRELGLAGPATAPVEQYTLSWSRKAEGQLSRLPADQHERVVAAIEQLRVDARPRGTGKIQRYLDLWRIKVGDHRVVYEIDDETREVVVREVMHRKTGYDNLG